MSQSRSSLTSPSSTVWRPIADVPSGRVTVACYADNGTGDTATFIGNHGRGQFFPVGGIVSCEEMGWIPYAWTEAPPQPESAKAFGPKPGRPGGDIIDQ